MINHGECNVILLRSESRKVLFRQLGITKHQCNNFEIAVKTLVGIMGNLLVNANFRCQYFDPFPFEEVLKV